MGLIVTPWKINIEPENDGLEDDFPFPGMYSQVPCESFGVYTCKNGKRKPVVPACQKKIPEISHRCPNHTCRKSLKWKKLMIMYQFVAFMLYHSWRINVQVESMKLHDFRFNTFNTLKICTKPEKNLRSLKLT